MPSSAEVIKKLEEAGWRLKKSKGDHFHFVHPEKPGKVTVKHPIKDLGAYLISKMEKQAGMKLR